MLGGEDSRLQGLSEDSETRQGWSLAFNLTAGLLGATLLTKFLLS